MIIIKLSGTNPGGKNIDGSTPGGAFMTWILSTSLGTTIFTWLDSVLTTIFVVDVEG